MVVEFLSCQAIFYLPLQRSFPQASFVSVFVVIRTMFFKIALHEVFLFLGLSRRWKCTHFSVPFLSLRCKKAHVYLIFFMISQVCQRYASQPSCLWNCINNSRWVLICILYRLFIGCWIASKWSSWL